MNEKIFVDDWNLSTTALDIVKDAYGLNNIEALGFVISVSSGLVNHLLGTNDAATIVNARDLQRLARDTKNAVRLKRLENG